MTDMINKEANRKKFLAPLVVLLLCGVALTGAAYAYTAGIFNIGDDVSVEGVSITLKDADNKEVEKAMFNCTFGVTDYQVNGRAWDMENSKAFDANRDLIDTDDDTVLDNLAKGYYMKAVAVANTDTYTVNVQNNSTGAVKVTIADLNIAAYSGTIMKSLKVLVYVPADTEEEEDDLAATLVVYDNYAAVAAHSEEIGVLEKDTTGTYTVKVVTETVDYLLDGEGANPATHINPDEKKIAGFDLKFTAATA